MHDEIPPDREAETPAPERGLLTWFFIILAVNVASLLWLSVRADSPQYIRSVLDFLMYGTTGIVAAYFAFRALFLYPFRNS